MVNLARSGLHYYRKKGKKLNVDIRLLGSALLKKEIKLESTQCVKM